MRRRRFILLVAALLLVLGGCYIASPWWATSRMHQAARAGDGERLARYVDYPALRANLTEQIKAGLLGTPSPSERRDPFAAFGEALAGTLVSAMVDAMITPESVAAMMDRGQARPADVAAGRGSAPERGAGSRERERVERRRHYESLDVFVVDMHDGETHDHLLTLVFHREGWFGWKLAGLRGPRS